MKVISHLWAVVWSGTFDYSSGMQKLSNEFTTQEFIATGWSIQNVIETITDGLGQGERFVKIDSPYLYLLYII